MSTEEVKKNKVTVHAVAALIMRDDKLLVAERPEGKPYAGYWEFPGGKVEEGETGQQAIQRELHEEIGINATEMQHWFEHLHAYPDKTVLLELWRIDGFEGEPQSLENQELRWVNYDEILHLQLLEGNLEILSKIKSVFAG